MPVTAPGPDAVSRRVSRRVALVGNPNVGKTTLFNRLCGLRSKTANFPGSTVDAHVGTVVRNGHAIELVDLPGVYALDLDLPESRLCRDCLGGRLSECRPDAVVVVVDATNLARNLQFAMSVARDGLPAVLAITMSDLAARKGLSVDERLIAGHVGCPVVVASGRTGAGLDALLEAIPCATACAPNAREGEALGDWAARVVEESVGGRRASGTDHDSIADRLDSAFTHPIVGSAIFALVMAALFLAIFLVAQLPMSLIESTFATLSSLVRTALPEGLVADLVAGGVIDGLAATLVFLPQICLLFFLLSLLEDTGYLARAAFVMDRIMCRFGLPGQAFVPLLSSHACALPGIMSARLIPDRHDRLATILVAPFMSCSARVPVYVLLTTLLFPSRPIVAGLAFAGCYVLGATAALLSAAIARRSILKGRSRPMVLELPSYKWPSLRAASLTTLDRARTFLVNAGTVIMAISVVMWWLSAFPRVDPPPQATEWRAQAETASPDEAELLAARADALEAEAQQRGSFAAMVGNAVQPVFAPLGYDSQLTVGVLTSFLAREVFVTTMTVLVGTSDDIGDEGVREQLVHAKRSDGSPIFEPRTNASLLVFFVLAMQCLPTLAVTRRETGSVRWALLQLGWMSLLAYVAALATYQGLGLLGVGGVG